MCFSKISLLLLMSYLVYGDVQLPKVLLNTTVGQIYGMKGDDFTMFLGVPYGIINEKDPFGPAVLHPPFITPYQAYDDSVVCPQYFKGEIKGTIQCLHLNVYLPNTAKRERTWPVMVYIHGGAFAEGNGRLSTYSPKFLVRHDVIFVTANYRLGPYGHLCFPRSEYSNQGLKDQNLALKWIKDNIKSFGGDSDNILLFGHSSGSVSVDFHLLYSNDNLFNKVILQSGNAVNPYCSEEAGARSFAKKLGIDHENIDVEQLVQKASTIDTNTVIDMTKYDVFRPCIDDIFIPKTPKMKNLQNIKIMIGGTSKEMLYFYPMADGNFFENYDFVAELEKGFNKLPYAALDIVSKFYFDRLKDNIIDFISDFAFNYPLERSVKYYLKNNATIYKYSFSYDGGRNFMKLRENINESGSTHGDELGYIYDMPRFGNVTEADQFIIDTVSYLWTNFAKYGNPTPSPSSLVPMKLKPLTADAQPYIQIDIPLKIYNSGPFHQHIAFWELFYERYGIYSKGINLDEDWVKCQYENINKSTSIHVDLSNTVLLLSVVFLSVLFLRFRV